MALATKNYIYLYTYTDIMGTKTISIMDDAYEMLVGSKLEDESFSDEVRRLVKTKSSIMDLAGAWKDISETDAERMKARIMERRKDRSRLDENRR